MSLKVTIRQRIPLTNSREMYTSYNIDSFDEIYIFVSFFDNREFFDINLCYSSGSANFVFSSE